MERKIYTVTELNTLAKNLIEENFSDIILSDIILDGEISNFKRHSSGHLYFSLKDEKSQISAVMYRFYAQNLSFIPKDGIEVRVLGTVSIYSPRGSYQIIVEKMFEKGLGDLKKRFEELKRKLEKEGLMAQARKRPLPLLPRKIGIITSPTGAAIRDILTVIKRRFSNVHLILYPVRVQGEFAKDEIAEAIYDMNKYFPDVDVLIVGRGGGSLEDLFAFNEEVVARAIFASKIPVISAVGHEIDWTISDMVADFRAATPSVAAEIVLGKKEDFLNNLTVSFKRMFQAVKNKFSGLEQRFQSIIKRPYFENPYLFLGDFEQKVDLIVEDFHMLVEKVFKEYEEKVKNLEKNLKVLSPENILSRGYSITTDKKGKIIKDEKTVQQGDEVDVKLWKGKLNCKVLNKNSEDL